MKKRKLFKCLFAASVALGITTMTSCDFFNQKPATQEGENENKGGNEKEEAKVTSLTITGADNEVYDYGTKYEPSSSIKVTAVYSDGNTKDVSDKVSYSVAGADLTGSKTVTVSYENVSTTYKVNVAKYAKTSVADGKILMNGTEYETIAKAFAAIPAASTDVYTINLGKGTYNENGLTYNGSATVRIVGSTDAKYGADVVIKGHGSKMPGETGCDSRNRCLISIQGNASIILENVTLESDWSRADHAGDVQAEVLGTDTTGNTAAYNCGFKSHQDTLRTISKAWFYQCYIEGDVDFIWMEAGGKVALYEECEIVSVWDEAAKTHNTYFTAPKMAETLKLGKGLVIYNSKVHESAEAKDNGQKSYMARTPWSSGCYNQVAYINSEVSDIELSDGPWYKSQIATPFAKTAVGWKMDMATAKSVGIDVSEKDYILDDETVAAEFNGRRAILNRVYDTGKLRYITDSTSNWDINALIGANGWTVAEDNSVDKDANDTMGEATVYNFKVENVDGATCEGFKYQENGNNTHYVGVEGETITIPVDGKCYVEVYGYYAGTAEATADTQEGKQIMFFNNNTTSSEVENDYIVYDTNAKSFTITAKATTYITKIVVIPDSAIEEKLATSLTITNLKPKQIVGVPQTLKAEVGPKGVLNTSVEWSSSNTEIATVDKYTGKVNFLKEGKVTITATACDGSGVTKSVECNPIIPTWTAIEWYTTDADIVAEKGANGIDMFDTNGSTNKSIGTEYSFKNMAGTTITTKYGFKLNSSGKLSFATLRYAEVTLIVAPKQNELVNPPSITNADGSKAMLLSSYVDNITKLQYFKYSLTATGMWDIERLDVTVENNPIIYAKVEYVSTDISESVGLTFKGSHYTTSKTGIETIMEPGSPIDATNTTIEFYKFKLTNCCSNGAATNWLRFNSGAKIEFTVSGPCTLQVGYYSKLQTIKLDGVVVEGNKTSVYSGAGEIVEYEITAAGVVTIESSVDDYLGFVGIIFRTLADKKEIAVAELEKAYPAAKYTKNADYEATLEQAEALIEAATTDAELKTAIASANTLMDALEEDPEEVVVGPAKYLNYVFASLTDKPADGTPVASTSQITFVNCVAHNGQYIALKTGNEVKINLAAGATLVVEMPYSSGVTLNGEAYTLVNDKLVYTATSDGEVVITGAAGGAYITTITVTTPLSSLNYEFASLTDKPAYGNPVASFDGVTFVNCVVHDSVYIALKENNAVKINLAAGATLTVNMPYSSGVTLNGEAYTLVNNKLVYTATADGEVVITGAAGNAYITSITITSPVSSLDYKYSLVANGAAQGTAVANTDEITFVGCVEHDGTGKYIRLTDNNAVKISLAKGATLTVYMPYSSGVTINGQSVSIVNDKVVYTATEAGVVTISGAAGSAYITRITVTSPVSSVDYKYKENANGAAQNANVASTNEIKFTGCVEHDGSGTYIRLTNNNAVTINVVKGAILTVYMPYSSGVTLNGEAYTLVNDKLVYEALADGEVVISGAAGGAYITRITVSMPVSSLDYNYPSVANGAAQGTAVANTDEITFVGCVEHDGSGKYIRLTDNNSVTINVAKGATLTVYMPYSSGVTLNGEAYTLVNDKLVYTAEKSGEVVISGAAGGAYITRITVSSPVSSLNYNYSSVANGAAAGSAVASTNEITFAGCVEHDGTGTYIALKENNSVSINLAAGATLTIDMPYTSGTVYVNGEAVELNNGKLVYTATTAGVVVITATPGQAYITAIKVTKA